MTIDRFVACDLGAESCRVLLGTLEDGRLLLEEIHRFPNGAVAVANSLRWDLLRIFEELKVGCRKVGARGLAITGISCDSWGVDYVLLHANEPMLTAPYHYRDTRTEGALERAFALAPADEIFAETGIQFMPINTLLAENNTAVGKHAAENRFDEVLCACSAPAAGQNRTCPLPFAGENW
jgi:rhamnulokinase